MTIEELKNFMLRYSYEVTDEVTDECEKFITFTHKRQSIEIFFNFRENGTFCNIFDKFGINLSWNLRPLSSLTKFEILEVINEHTLRSCKSYKA